MSRDSSNRPPVDHGGNVGAFPYRYVDASPDKLLGPVGLERFQFQLLDLYAQLDSEHVVRKGPWAHGQIVITLDVELDEDGHGRVTHNVKTKGPKMQSGSTTTRIIDGVVLAEEENPDMQQGRLPGFTPAELDAEERRRAVKAVLDDMSPAQRRVYLGLDEPAEPALPTVASKPEPRLPSVAEKPEPELGAADDDPEGDSSSGGDVVSFPHTAGA